MQTLKRAPQLTHPIHLCTQCRAASTTKAQKHRLAIKSTSRDLAERASILRTRVHSARLARREDWHLGPLAPNRAAADDAYGCVSGRELSGVKRVGMTRQGKSPYAAEEMSWRENMIEVGDRVVVVAEKGPASRERGKVGRVTEVRKSEGEVLVEDLNQVDIKAPPYVLASEPGSPPIRTVPLPLPLSAIRLLYPLTYTRTTAEGTTETYKQESIISRLVHRPGYKGRYIANSDRLSNPWISIPKNPAYEKEKPEPKTHDADTTRFEVEDSTWTPTLLRAPMPAGVIDELRGKYSKHRTRHEPGYQLALENRARRTAEYKAWAKSGAVGMLNSPAKEARAREVVALREKGRQGLERSVLEKIGEVMAGKGIEMTEGRRREVERNLRGEEVLGGGEGGLGNRGSEDVDVDIDGTEAELNEAMDRLGVDEMVIEEVEGDERRV